MSYDWPIECECPGAGNDYHQIDCPTYGDKKTPHPWTKPITTIINLYGGPGTGKSTSAAMLFAMAKQKGVNAELVREYVKEWAWEGRKPGPYDQLYFLGKQARKESLLYGKVDLVITDSPVMLGVYYADKFSPPYIKEAVRHAAHGFYSQAEADGYRHVHVKLIRSKAYNPKGRYQTEHEARAMDYEIRDMLITMGIRQPIECGTDEASLARLLDEQTV